MYRDSRRNRDNWQGAPSSGKGGKTGGRSGPTLRLLLLSVLDERVMTAKYAVQIEKQQMTVVSQRRAQMMLSEHAASKKKGDAPYVAMKVVAKARAEQLQAKRLYDQNCRVPIRSRPDETVLPPAVCRVCTATVLAGDDDMHPKVFLQKGLRVFVGSFLSLHRSDDMSSIVHGSSPALLHVHKQTHFVWIWLANTVVFYHG